MPILPRRRTGNGHTTSGHGSAIDGAPRQTRFHRRRESTLPMVALGLVVALAAGVGLGIYLQGRNGSDGAGGGTSGHGGAESGRIRALVIAVAEGLERGHGDVRLQGKLDQEVRARGPAAVAELMSLLSEGSNFQKAVALGFLARLGRAAEGAIPLARELQENSREPFVRYRAAQFLEALGARPEPARTEPGVTKAGRAWELVALYNKECQGPAAGPNAAAVREKILAEVKAIGRVAVSDLTRVVKTGAGEEVVTALLLLTHLGKEAAEAAPAVRQLRELSKDPKILEQAERFLAAVGEAGSGEPQPPPPVYSPGEADTKTP